MLNFLLQKNKKKIISEYLLRLSVYLTGFVFMASFVLIALFIPSFFFAEYKNESIKQQLESIEKENLADENDPISFIKNVNKLSVILADDQNPVVKNSDIVNKILSLKNKNIKILAISISKDATNGRRIMVNGIANARDDLTQFNNDLKTDGFFSSVVFPVSNFIKSSDADFSATLTL